MNRVSRRILGLADEYKTVLVLAGVIMALGLLMGPAPRTPEEVNAALHRVYSLDAQPVVCKPERTPPTR